MRLYTGLPDELFEKENKIVKVDKEGMPDDLKKIHQNDYETKFIVVGKTGNGKSSMGNTLLWRNHFEKNSHDPATIRIVDTPGLFECMIPDSDFSALFLKRCIEGSLPLLIPEIGTVGLSTLFYRSGIVTYEEMYKSQNLETCFGINKKIEQLLKDIRPKSYQAFIRCLIESGYDYVVQYMQRIILLEIEKWLRSVEKKDYLHITLTQFSRRTMFSEFNLHAWKHELGINRRYLWKYSFWNEDHNTSFLSDNNEKDLGEYTMRSAIEVFQYHYRASLKISLQTDKLPVNVKTIADGSFKMHADEAFRELEQMLMCKVCLDADLCIVFLPCRHMSTCERCASVLQSCPVCRSTIQDSVKFNYE